MAITSTQTTNVINNMAVGRFLDTGTVAAAKITTGFKPRYVKVINVTSGDSMEWFEGMAAAAGVKQVAAGTRTLATSNGITVATDGFTIGLDTDVMVTSEQISWIAMY
jgi:hypothetical protein